MCGIWISSNNEVEDGARDLIKNRGRDYFCEGEIDGLVYMVSILGIRGFIKQPIESDVFMLYNGEIYNSFLSDTLYLNNVIVETSKTVNYKMKEACNKIEMFKDGKWIFITEIENINYNMLPSFKIVEDCMKKITYENEMALIFKIKNFIYFIKDGVGKRSLGFSFSNKIVISSILFENEVDSKYIYSYSIKRNELYRTYNKTHFLKPLPYYITNTLNRIDNMDVAILRVKHILTTSLKNMTHDYNNVVFFSGGVDSLLITVLLNNVLTIEKPIYLINTEFITNKSSTDRISSILAYNELKEKYPRRKFILIENNITLETISEYKEHIKKLIHPKNTMMDLNIGICLFFTAMSAAKYTKAVFLGCGADELFCGYNKHKMNGICLKTSVYNVISNLFERNLGRDDRVISDNNIEGRYPFLSTELIETMLNIDTSLLFGEKNLNKIIIRKILESEGFIRASLLKKTAMQFGSGIQKWEKLRKK